MADEIIIETTSTEVIEVGVPGPQGATGANGTNGQGVPVGGTTGQVLRKASGTNYDTEWAAAGSGSGSVTSVALAGTGLSISGSPITTSGTITANVAFGTTAGTAAEGNDARLSDARTPTSHAHGNITNAGLVGTTSGLPLKTGTGGIVEAGAFGTSAGQFAQGNDSRIANILKSGTADGEYSGGTGGSINLAGGNANESENANGGNAGSINLVGGNGYAGAGANGGSINLSGGYDVGNGGSIDLSSAGNQSGGSIVSVGGNNATGGSLTMSAGASGNGGGITTSNGGGSIDTRGTGSIELGVSETRTTLTGTATAARAISLPNASGTIALTSDFAAPPAIGNTTPAAGSFTTLSATGDGTINGFVIGATSIAPTSGSRNYQTNTGEGLVAVTSGAALAAGTNAARFAAFSNNRCGMRPEGELGWASSGAPSSSNFDVILRRDAAGVLAQYNAANAQTFRIYNTYTDASNHERGFMRWSSNVLQIGTEALGTGSARALELQTGGTTRFTIATNGAITCTSSLSVVSNLVFQGNAAIVGNIASGVLRLVTASGLTDFNRLQFGGGTASFPALKRSSTVLQARLADDTGFAPLQGQLRIHQNAVAETPTATHTMTLFDAAGTAYKVLCVAA